MRRLIIALCTCVLIAPAASVGAVTLDGVRVEAPGAKPGRVIGRLIIPRLGVNHKMYLGVSNAEFDLGVGKWPGTPRPGEAGNIVIGGHRTSGIRPFYNIERLKRGDIITVVEGRTRARYKVTNRMVVKPTAMWVTKQSSSSTITLFSCHPRGSTKQRYIVRATLIR
jgi:sortase A